MDDIRIAIVGLGSRGLWWIDLLQKLKGFRITAIADPVKATHAPAMALLKNAHGVKRYTHYEDVLADDNVTAVGLTVRTLQQGAMAAMALEAGKHCIQEVPAAHTMEDCWRLVLAQERSNKVYLCAEQCRYAGFVEAWRKLVAEGTLGNITYAEGQYFHYYVGKCFRDPVSGKFYPPAEARNHPGAQRTPLWHMPPIHYLVHDLSPLLKVLDDRVTEVMGMSTRSPSMVHPELQWPDMQVALMKTAKGAVLRLATSFAQPHPEAHTHWLQVIGMAGCVELGRTSRDKPRMWLAGSASHDKIEMDWTWQRSDEPEEARGSGHGNTDYYTHAAFRDAVLGVAPLEFDVYKAMEVAVAGVLAAESIAQGGRKLLAPDFRPGPWRTRGESPVG